MDRQLLATILNRVASGELTVDDALVSLRDYPVAQLKEASLDMQRAIRRGHPEVVLGEGKSVSQICDIVGRLLQHDGTILITRISHEAAAALDSRYPDHAGEHCESASAYVIRQKPVVSVGTGTVAIVTAGTSDAPVAHEAALTCELMGNDVNLIFDVGVAGLHRLLGHLETIQSANVVVVVAGMEGALASVVAGMVDRPVIAVPTSVGYGSSFEGLTALLGMLNSCAAGVTVVNIDNGFGAGYAASLMNRRGGDE